MPKIDLVQGSSEWKEARRKLVTATDAANIMGIGFKTPYQTWLAKLSGEEEPENHYMIRGSQLEPEARDVVEKELRIVLWPEFHISPKFQWMAASLDGLSSDGTLVEIKCPGERTHNIALSGKIPEYYLPQLQHQMEVVGVDRMIYFSYFPDYHTPFKIIEVKKGDNSEMIMKEEEFYKCLKEIVPPEFNRKDYVDLSLDEEFQSLASRYLDIEKILNGYEQEKEQLRSTLCSYAKRHNVKGKGISISRTMRKGFVEYGKIPELNCIDVEKYRKAPIESYKISVK